MEKMITPSIKIQLSTQMTILLKLAAVFLLLIGQNTSLSAQSKAITSLTGGSNFVFNNQGFTVGYEFTANQTMTVSDLGFYDAGSDGLATAHNVGIYNLCGTLLTSGTVASGTTATLDNGFRYVSVTPIVLAAGTTYRVGAVVFNGGGNDAFLNGVTTINTNAAITFKKGVTNNGLAGLQYPSLNAADIGLSANSSFGPNFIFATGGTPPSAPEIDILGNSVSIPLGTTATSTSNHTDFGSVANGSSFARTFTIDNTVGTATLTISSITSSNTKFVVSNVPPSVSAGSSGTFTVTFNPTAAGAQTATITVNNNDCDEGTYTFAVTGTGFNTYTFNGTTNTDWATASNWSPAIVPTSLVSGHAVVIAANCVMNDVVISFPSGTSLTVNSGITLSPSLNTFITIASGATLTVNASASMSQGRITNTGTMDIYGSYTAFYMTNNSGGVMNIKSGGSYSCPACAETMNAGSTINNTGTMHLGTGSTWQCTVNNNVGGTITDGDNGAQIQLGSSSSVVNAGTFVSRTAGTAGNFTNSGILLTPGTCNFTIKTGATMTNSGNMTFASSDNVLNIQLGATLTNTGTVTNNGTMSVAGTFTNNGTYKGSGTYSGSVFTNPSGAIVAPGNSAGCTTFSNGFTNNGILQIELGGNTGTCPSTTYDVVNVTGTATLGGTLDVSLINGYTGTGNHQITVINATALSGIFASVSLPPNWFRNYNAPAAGQVTLSFNAVLPLELLNFTATPSVSSVNLDWTTANEVNNKGFQIERLNSLDNKWEILSFVSTKGKAAIYTFVDKAPLSINYYRLRQIDTDSKETLSKVVSVSLKDKGSLKVYPNPVTHLLTLEAQPNDVTGYQIFNLLGKQVLNGKTMQQIDVSVLPQGAYYLKIGIEQVKFVKQ